MGSGLYMVASHGGSPSGRLRAVRGRSNSPDLVPGLWCGVGVPIGLLLVEIFLVAPDTLRPDDVLGGEPGVAAVLGRLFVGDDVLGVNNLDVVGVVTKVESPSSRKG